MVPLHRKPQMVLRGNKVETLKDIRLNDKEIQQIVLCLKDKLSNYEKMAFQLIEGSINQKELTECIGKSREVIYLIGKLEGKLEE